MNRSSMPFRPGAANVPTDYAAVLSVSDPTVEAVTVGPVNLAAVGLSGTVPTSVYTTSKRWRAIDVFVRVGGTGGGSVQVLIYAIGAQGRALVASGRAGVASFSSDGEWVAGARAQAQRFEVVIAAAAATTDVYVTAIASDHADPVPPSVGAVFGSAGMRNGSTALGLAGAGSIGLIAPELVEYQAINVTGAAPLYFFVAAAAVGAVVGATPVVAWPVGATAGAGSSAPILYRVGSGAVSCGLSTSPSVIALPAAGAGFYNVLVR